MRQRQNLVGRELAFWRTGAKRRAQTVLGKFGSLVSIRTRFANVFSIAHDNRLARDAAAAALATPRVLPRGPAHRQPGPQGVDRAHDALRVFAGCRYAPCGGTAQARARAGSNAVAGLGASRSLLLSCDRECANLTDSCAIERGGTGTRLALVRELPDDHGEEARGHCRARGGARAAAR